MCKVKVTRVENEIKTKKQRNPVPIDVTIKLREFHDLFHLKFTKKISEGIRNGEK